MPTQRGSVTLTDTYGSSTIGRPTGTIAGDEVFVVVVSENGSDPDASVDGNAPVVGYNTGGIWFDLFIFAAPGGAGGFAITFGSAPAYFSARCRASTGGDLPNITFGTPYVGNPFDTVPIVLPSFTAGTNSELLLFSFEQYGGMGTPAGWNPDEVSTSNRVHSDGPVTGATGTISTTPSNGYQPIIIVPLANPEPSGGGSVVDAVLSATFTFAAGVAADVLHVVEATAAAAFAFTAAADATPITVVPATLAATFTFTAGATATVIHPATFDAIIPFTAAIAAEVIHSAAVVEAVFSAAFTFTAGILIPENNGGGPAAPGPFRPSNQRFQTQQRAERTYSSIIDVKARATFAFWSGATATSIHVWTDDDELLIMLPGWTELTLPAPPPPPDLRRPNEIFLGRAIVDHDDLVAQVQQLTAQVEALAHLATVGSIPPTPSIE